MRTYGSCFFKYAKIIVLWKGVKKYNELFFANNSTDNKGIMEINIF